MKQAPNLWNMEDLPGVKDAYFGTTLVNINGKWVPARPLGLYSLKNRLRLTWMVFVGKADALKWPEGQ